MPCVRERVRVWNKRAHQTSLNLRNDSSRSLLPSDNKMKGEKTCGVDVLVVGILKGFHTQVGFG